MTSRARREAGFNLVILVVAIAVMNILVAMALPLWRTAIQREKEEELISRGFQYAEAIRIFQHRFGRMPLRLEELVEVRPRCIRQLWTDPITGKADWVPIRAGMPGQGVPPQQGDGGPGGEGSVDANGDGQPDTPDGGASLGPIRGVRSRSGDESIKKLFDQERYDQWQFTVEQLQVGPVNAGGVGVPAPQSSRVSLRWLGRPFRPGLTGPRGGSPPPGSGAPGGQQQQQRPRDE